MIFLPDTISAHQWWKNGDHPLDSASEIEVSNLAGEVVLTHLEEGHFIRYYRSPDQPATAIHTVCGSPWHNHGWIDDLNTFVCPGAWVAESAGGFRVVWPTIDRVERGADPGLPARWYTDCRTCPDRVEHDNYDIAFSVAAEHAVAEKHVVDTYGVAES